MSVDSFVYESGRGMYKGKQVQVAATDLSKAFDVVPHKHVNSIEFYGIRGCTLKNG